MVRRWRVRATGARPRLRRCGQLVPALAGGAADEKDKGHAEFAQRNVPWADWFAAPLHELPQSALQHTLKWHPLFQPEYALPTLPAFLMWLQQHLSHLLPLNALMAEAEAVRGAVEWTHRGAVAALQLTCLLAYYDHALPLSRKRGRPCLRLRLPPLLRRHQTRRGHHPLSHFHLHIYCGS